MDPLRAFLDGPRASDAFLLRALLAPPWSLRIQDEAPLAVVALTGGTAAIRFDDGEEAVLGAGDVAIVRGPDHYLVAHDLATPVQVVIHPGERCTTPDGVEIGGDMDLGVRTWGNSPHGSTVMLVGAYQSDGEVSRRMLDALPRLIVVRAGSSESPAVALLSAEIVRDDPGQEVVLDRLLDLVLVATLRAAFAEPGAAVPDWYRAQGDPVVGPAVQRLLDDPAEPWTVATLAASVGVSRAGLARRFHDLVGQPPMAFLTGWRMALAADLLLEPGATVGGVSRQVGYGSPFTFSTAFKRTYGASPRAHRDQALIRVG